MKSLSFQHQLYWYFTNECMGNGYLILLGYCNQSQQAGLKHFLSGVLVSFSSFRCPVKSRSIQSIFHVLLRCDEHFLFGTKHNNAIRLDCLNEWSPGRLPIETKCRSFPRCRYVRRCSMCRQFPLLARVLN